MKPAAPAGRTRIVALIALLLLPLLALLLAGCGGGGSPSSPVTSVSVSYYYISSSGVLPITATVGDRVQLLAEGLTATGGQIQLDSGVTWHSTNGSAASVNATGMLTAAVAGSTQITATWGSFTSPPLAVTVAAPGATPTATYYPFAAGNQWLYTGTAVAPATATPPLTLTVTAVDQVVLEGLVWWELRINYTDLEAGWMYLRHDAQGLREVIYVTAGSSIEPQYTYPVETPLTAGGHWTDPTRPTEHYWDLLSATASVTVPAGTYKNCVQVRESDVDTDGTPFTTTVWYAAAVGIVQTDTPATTDVVTGVVTPDNHQELLSEQLSAAALSAGRARPAPGRAMLPWVGRSPLTLW